MCANEECKVQFAVYFCKVCNLFDDEGPQKQVFHCDGCGICRVGGRENNFHCEVCECCLPTHLKNDHKCTSGKLKQDCAVCLDNMQNSVKSSILLRCGHAMHSECFQGYVKTNI